ncbi:MAG: hypothetical protein LQ347_000265 [Umbilicaria vellea]|nr:MAG: hypothetical protein LQ347_000265 [Umbilicaria vellea]
MNATTPEVDPVHIEQSLSASRVQSPCEAKAKIQPDLNSTPVPTASVRRSATSTALVASPPAAISDRNTPRASPEQLDWSKSITPNSFSFNDLPRWSPNLSFLSRERTNSKAQPQSTSHKMSKDTVPVITKDVGAQAEIVKKSTLKENESPSVRPKKVESQNIQVSQGRDDQNGAWIPPHLRPPSPPTLLVDVPAYVDAIAILAELEEEDAHLPPHLRRPARKDKPLKASPVVFVAAKMPQILPSEPNGRSGDQTQHNTSAEIKQVVTPLNPTQDHKESAITHIAAPALCENPPVESAPPAVLPLRARGRPKAFDKVKPYRAMWEQDGNGWGSASIDSNVAVNDGETKPRFKLQYEPQLHDWAGNWAPAPVEWDARPSFDNTDSRHMKAMEAWLDERAGAALKKTIKIDTSDPQYLDGGKPAGGLEELDLPIEDEAFETLLPNDPFTHARIHQTANDSARAYQKKVYKEKKASKADRKAYIAATKLHYASYVPPPNPHVPKANIYIRPAGASDMRQVTEIYNHYVKNSVVASERMELTEAQWQARWRDSTGENFAFLVAVLKNGNRGGRFRRDNAETIVGFAYAEDFSGSATMYRFTCELQFWVHPQHLRHGIGKTLVDRMLPALDNGYYCRHGTDFVADNPIEYEGGGLRTISRILISIPHDPTDAQDLTWLKKWLSQWDFEQVGNMPGIGRKFDKE